MTDLLDEARRLAADPAAWAVRPHFDPAERWYARLARADDHEAWLLTWLPGQHTDLHDHGGATGAFVVVAGTLTEETLARGGGRCRLVSRTLAVGDHRSFGARHVHRVANLGTGPAVSVHVYAPALRSMTRYLVDGERVRATATERAGVAW
jgi:predicted metal-dependent enzyme (double-stranded beta helix superfamily)